MASASSAPATTILWLWHQVIQQQPQLFCGCGSSHNDSVAVASANSAPATTILWLWHPLFHQQPQ